MATQAVLAGTPQHRTIDTAAAASTVFTQLIETRACKVNF